MTQLINTHTNHQVTPSMSTQKDLDNCELAKLISKVANEQDRIAFTQLFRFFAPKIQAFGYKQFNTAALANDLVQDTMTNIWRKSHYFNQEKGQAKTWVFSIMRNAAFDLLRKIKNKKEVSLSNDIWPLEEAPKTEHAYPDHLMVKQMKSYVQSLPEKQKQIIQGVYFQELTQEEVAKKLNIPLGTVKSRLRTALIKLQKNMETL